MCLLLVLITAACYWRILGHDFINLDDHQYLLENGHVKTGVTWSGVVWAFTSGYASNWHPLTWISHMLDCQWFGLKPAGHHFVNLLFHIANSVLLFFLLRQMAGALWRSAFVAALFAWHPLHVESVAWAAERKDVLSAFFWILTMMAYWKYSVFSIQCSVAADRGIARLRSRYYAVTLVLFALGLMSKPMLVTLPFALLLMDYWPLQRFQLATCNLQLATRAVWPLLREKLPFFAMSIVASVVTYKVQSNAESSWEALPLSARCANAVVAYARYLAKSFWPSDLAVMYPYSRHLPTAWVLGAAALLVLISVWFVSRAKRRSYLIVGWLWFLGALVPTIGLVQVGSQAMADRYMYIPSIGLFLLVVWGLDDLVNCRSRSRKAGEALISVAPRPDEKLEPHPPCGIGSYILSVVGIVALAACAVITKVQAGYWQNSEKLFRHAIEATSGNFIAYDALGTEVESAGRREEGLALLEKAVALNPRFPEAQYDLGTVLMKMGRRDDAVVHFQAALKDNPGFAHAHINLGKTLLDQGKPDEAAEHYSKAVHLTPDDPEAQFNLGTVWLTQSKVEAAVACLQEAVRLRPDYAEAQGHLGVALMRLGRAGEGAAHFAEAARLNPGNADAHVNLGIAFLELNRPSDATNCFAAALRLQSDEAGRKAMAERVGALIAKFEARVQK